MSYAKTFFEENKKYTTQLPNVPAGLETNKEIVNWIFSQNISNIKLNTQFDVAMWKAESIKALPYLVNHREAQPHEQWRSCCIHGISIDKTGEWRTYAKTEPNYNWTTLSELTPTITKFWKQFPFEKLLRVRFMELGPGGWVYPHNDTPPGFDKEFNFLEHIVPVNIAIDHPENCFMTLEQHGVIPWEAGDVRIVNIKNTHSVINFSDKPRMHMIGHGIIGNRAEEFYKLILDSYNTQL